MVIKKSWYRYYRNNRKDGSPEKKSSEISSIFNRLSISRLKEHYPEQIWLLKIKKITTISLNNNWYEFRGFIMYCKMVFFRIHVKLFKVIKLEDP